MALTTYAELVTAVGSWLWRDDMAAVIPDFIALFEAAANRRLMGLRQMETSTNLTPSAGDVALPTDYLSTRRVTWTGSTRVELEYVHPSMLQRLYPSSSAGSPTSYTIEGSTLKIRPTDGTALEFDYFQKIPPLVSGLNWLFTNNPDLYLFGSLVESQAFIREYDQAVLWKARRDELIEELLENDRKSRGPAAIRVMGATP